MAVLPASVVRKCLGWERLRCEPPEPDFDLIQKGTREELRLPTAESRGVLLSFHLSPPRDRASMETNRISSRRRLPWRTSALPSRLLFFRSLLLSLPARAHLQALFRERNEAREEVLLKYSSCTRQKRKFRRRPARLSSPWINPGALRRDLVTNAPESAAAFHRSVPAYGASLPTVLERRTQGVVQV
jgi:hypothetical protein